MTPRRDAVRRPGPQRGRGRLVHDWLTGMRGGEKVLEAICELYPDADCLRSCTFPGSVSPRDRTAPDPDVARPAAAAQPGAATGTICRSFRRHRAVRSRRVDLVITTSHCAAKSVVRPGRRRHVCYCHSPMRYAWDQFDAYFGPDRVGPARSRAAAAGHGAAGAMGCATRPGGSTASSRTRSMLRAGSADTIIVRSTVVYPPVDTDFYRPRLAVRDPATFLVVSALVPYKRIDVAIEACRLAGVPLRIVGRRARRGALRGLPARRRVSRVAHATKRFVTCIGAPPPSCCRAKRISASCRSKRRPAARRWSRWHSGGALETVVDGRHRSACRRRAGAGGFADGLIAPRGDDLRPADDPRQRRTLLAATGS